MQKSTYPLADGATTNGAGDEASLGERSSTEGTLQIEILSGSPSLQLEGRNLPCAFKPIGDPITASGFYIVGACEKFRLVRSNMSGAVVNAALYI